MTVTASGYFHPKHLSHHLKLLPVLGNPGCSKDFVQKIPLPKERHGNGGWVRSSSEMDIFHCNISRTNSGLDREEFIRDFLSLNKPVIVSGAIEEWPAWTNWQRQELSQSYGNITVDVGRIPYAETYGMSTKKMNVCE